MPMYNIIHFLSELNGLRVPWLIPDQNRCISWLLLLLTFQLSMNRCSAKWNPAPVYVQKDRQDPCLFWTRNDNSDLILHDIMGEAGACEGHADVQHALRNCQSAAPNSQSACGALCAVYAHAFHFHAQMNALKTYSERKLSWDKSNLILPSTIKWDIVFIPEVYNWGERISIHRLPNISRKDGGDTIGVHYIQPHLLPGCLFSPANDYNNISVGVTDLGNYCHNIIETSSYIEGYYILNTHYHLRM